MANKESTQKTILVAFLLCLVCSIVIAGSVVMLKPTQEINKALNLKANILAAAGLLPESGKSEDIEAAFSKIEAKIVDLDTGAYVEPDVVCPGNLQGQSRDWVTFGVDKSAAIYD